MKKRRKLKRENIILSGVRIEFVPNSEGGAKNAYIRVEAQSGFYLGSIFKKPDLKKIKRWADQMLEPEQ